LIKLNKNEAEYFTGLKLDDEDSLPDAGRILFDTFDTYSILITLGFDGMAYFDRKKYKKDPFRIKDNPIHVYDVCGAGDVVISVLAYFMSYGDEYNMENIIRYAAKAGKIAVSKKGTSVVTYDELWGDGI